MADMALEDMIIASIIHNEDFARAALPHIEPRFFGDVPHRKLFEASVDYMEKYKSPPTVAALRVWLDDQEISQDQYDQIKGTLKVASTDPNVEYQWMVDQAEKFCQDRAIYNAIMDSIKIIDGKTDKDKGAIPEILQNALGVTFDNHIGHDFLEDFETRYDYYHNVVERIEFDLEMMNKITRGGVPRKTLNIILGGTGGGKTLAMCHMSANNLRQGKNVLYITLEMAEERIAERIDANLMNIDIDMLHQLPKDTYVKKVNKIQEKTNGKLVIKEYPTGTVGSGHFRHLLNELRMKKNFVPDVVYVDYINLCLSSRMRMGGSINSYTYIKAIAEELRGLAVEFNIPLWSATQTNRTGFTSSDPGLEDTSESFGLPATADFMFTIINSEELEELGQVMIKQLKNRYNDPAINRRFVVGVDKPKMKMYDVESRAQEYVAPDITETGAGGRSKKPTKPASFDDWK